MLKVPLETLKWIDRKYSQKVNFKPRKAKRTPTLNIRPEGETLVTNANLKPDELNFIVS